VLTNVQPVEIQGTCYSYQFIASPDLKALFCVYQKVENMVTWLEQDLYWYGKRLKNLFSLEEEWIQNKGKE
jgi:hypothetical protein